MSHEHIGSPDEVQQLMVYISEVRHAMRLNNWDIVVGLQPTEDDTFANVKTWDNHNGATICFIDGFMTWDADVIRSTVVHELIHLTHRGVDDVWFGCTQNNDDVPVAQARGWNADFKQQMEIHVSDMTRLIAPNMPTWPPSTTKIADGINLQEVAG